MSAINQVRAKYRRWISKLKCVRCLCSEITTQMVEEFPELRRVRGHYVDSFSHQRHQHWWCVDEQGTIIDPTSSQFLDGGNGEYEPWNEEQAEPTGLCINCGGLVFDSSKHCSDACKNETVEFLNKRRGNL